MGDNIAVSTDAILSDINNASSRVENTTSQTSAVDDEIAAMRNKIQNRQMHLIATSIDDDQINKNDNSQIDLDNEEIFKQSGLEDALLMQRMQDINICNV